MVIVKKKAVKDIAIKLPQTNNTPKKYSTVIL